MLPEFPDLTRCKTCQTILWLSKLTELGTYDYDAEINTEWQNAPSADFLGIDGYFEVLEKGVAENKEDELYVRQSIWWAYNDRVRSQQNCFKDEHDELRWKENLVQFLNLLDASDLNQKIMMAEVNRNLGEFEKCIGLVESIDNSNLDWLKEKLVNECKRENRWVVKLST